MKYLILCFLILASGCQAPKPKTYVCISALGAAQFPENAEGVKVSSNYITAEQDGRYFSFPKSLCVVVQDK